MNEKKDKIFTEEEIKLKDIQKDISDVCNEARKKVDIYNKNRSLDINMYKKVDETEMRNAIRESKKLDEIKNNPYFGRMDLIYSGDKNPEKVYIGRQDFIVNNEAKIISWAAPIADVFNTGIGDFEKDVGSHGNNKGLKVSGKKIIKRKIFIKNGSLESVISEGDINYKEKEEEFIKEKLAKSSSTKLNDILETVQEDQNKIIRLPIGKSVFIQGCAGSGKSSVAYHRLSQLIYNDKLEYNQVLVIGPNKLFMNYTKTITTDLGMEFDVRQVTFSDLTKEIIGENFNHLKSLLKNKDTVLNTLKTSIKYKKFLDEYVDYLIEKSLPKKELNLSGYEIMNYNELKDIWDSRFHEYKLNTKITKFKEYIKNKLQNKKTEFIDLIEKEYETDEESLKDYCKSKSILEKKLMALKQEKVMRKERVKNQFDIIVTGYLKLIKEVDILEVYTELLIDANLIEKLGSDIFTIGELDLLINNQVHSSFLEIEDIPITYLYMKLNDLRTDYRHIVVDECQDLSVLELVVIEMLTKSFTFVGDLNQRIVNDRDNITYEYIKDIFNKYTLFNLNKSFRNSKNITNYANEIIKPVATIKDYLPIAFDRESTNPRVINVKNDSGRNNYIRDFILEKQDKSDSIAIIFKDINKCMECYNLISKKVKEYDIGLIIDENSEVNKKINILTAPLSKGLEFKTVIIGDVDLYGQDEGDRNLLYVQCTRALNELIILYKDLLPQMLIDISSDLYEFEEYRSEEELVHLRTCALNLLIINIKNQKERIYEIINSIDENRKLTAIINDYYKLKSIEDLESYL